jgi:hypothetical protein
MILTLDLPPELEQHLAKEAAQHGLSVEAMTLQRLATSLNVKQNQAETLDMLQSWIDDGDEVEQQETGRYLVGSCGFRVISLANAQA